MSNKQFRDGSWDSKYFGIDVKKIYISRPVYEIPWAEDLTIANTSDVTLIPELEVLGFRYITTKIYMQYEVAQQIKTLRNPNISNISTKDVDVCAEIISSSLMSQSPFTLSAKIFAKEHMLTSTKIKSMYDGWFRRIYNKLGSISLCITHKNKIAGAIVSTLCDNKVENELFAVDANLRGARLGTQLGEELFNRLSLGCTFETVINLHNITAIRLWGGLGAKSVRVEYVLHKWRD